MEKKKKSHFGVIYLLWALLSTALVYGAVLRHGMTGLSALMAIGWVLPAALALLYRPVKRVFGKWRVGLICAAAVLPLAGAAYLRLVPFCGPVEMHRIVAEGTTYFEEHREALEEQAAVSASDVFWRGRSEDTLFALHYVPEEGRKSSYLRTFELDEHWVIDVWDAYDFWIDWPVTSPQ